MKPLSSAEAPAGYPTKTSSNRKIESSRGTKEELWVQKWAVFHLISNTQITLISFVFSLWIINESENNFFRIIGIPKLWNRPHDSSQALTWNPVLFSWPEKLADVSHRHHWFPREMTSSNDCRNSILMTYHYPDLGICYWSRQISLARWPFRRTTQIWVVTHHQYRISAVAAQIPFRGKIIGNQWWRHEISAFFSGYYFRFAWLIKFRKAKRSDHVRECLGTVKTWTDRRIKHACRSRWIIYKITRALSAHVCVFIL